MASAVLVYGALTGKYANPETTGRIAAKLDEPLIKQALDVAPMLVELAARFSTTPAALAIAFALAGPRVASVLFGATRPEQVRANVQALDVDPAAVAELQRR